MDKTIILPRKNKTVAELAIIALSKKWPQSLGEIHSAIRQKRAVSMQATHKSLKKLVEQKILEKKQRQYSLNQQWLGKISTFGTQTKKAYSKQNQLFG